ncbi:MAG: ABC transporter permease subunit [Clostridioides difficile]|nr:ABC transporter permease subunit [Clostridioides difficile]
MPSNKLRPYFLIAPVSILLLSIMSVGLFNALLSSLGYLPQLGLTHITFDYYKEIFRDEIFLKSLLFSLKTSFISTVISVMIGVLISYFLCKNKFSKLRNSIIKLPVIIPHIVVILLMTTVFSQTGIISRLLYSLGFINDSSSFPLLLSDNRGIGIILVYLWKGIPFTVITTYNILTNVNDSLENVAINLGASKWQSFRYIALPLAMPSIISSFIILFAFSFGSYEVPFLIGPTTPKALPVLAYVSYISSNIDQKIISMVLNVILSCVSIVLLLIYNKIFNKINKYKYRR